MALKLLEALEIVQQRPPDSGVPVRVGLICSFTPLHLNTFLDAYLRRLLPLQPVESEAGLFGDLIGNLERAAGTGLDAIVLATEWPDFDPRLGFRSLGRWSPSTYSSIISDVQSTCHRLEKTVVATARRTPVVVSLPTLPFPPLSLTSSSQAGAVELQIQSKIAEMAARLSEATGVRIVNREYLGCESPAEDRYDIESDLAFGFPYKLKHASVLAETASRLVVPRASKKGIITDLDNTLWRGILGEEGVAGVSWSLEGLGQAHGIYQRFLDSLAEAGVLIGVASKNEPSLVVEALQRTDFALRIDSVYPIEAHWQPKSQSVARILQAWNISGADVVFIDDDPFELAEVKASYPDVECLRFPSESNAGVLDLVARLRELFAKTMVQEEDRIRVESLRRSPTMTESGSTPLNIEEVLEDARAELTLDFATNPGHPRVLELVNKTNQFNLNGKRHAEASWMRYFDNPQSFLLVADYKDRFGPLGKIAVVAGRQEDEVLFIDAWVMSCRAFSRRVEYRCLTELLERFDVRAIEFDFVPTARNKPFLDFLAKASGEEPSAAARLTREAFLSRAPKTFFHIPQVEHG